MLDSTLLRLGWKMTASSMRWKWSPFRSCRGFFSLTILRVLSSQSPTFKLHNIVRIHANDHCILFIVRAQLKRKPYRELIPVRTIVVESKYTHFWQFTTTISQRFSTKATLTDRVPEVGPYRLPNRTTIKTNGEYSYKQRENPILGRMVVKRGYYVLCVSQSI